MADVVAVLVVPAAGDPGGLLARPRTGGRPGVANRWNLAGDLAGATTPWEAGWSVNVRRSSELDGEHALALWWDGRVVEEGWDRARRIACSIPPRERPSCVAVFCADREMVETVAYALVGRDLASRVVRLARVDGRLVEVEP